MKKTDVYKSRNYVLKELKESFYKINRNYRYIKKLSVDGEEIIGSGEWLLDNIYLIEKEYKAIKFNMPIEYFESLPKKNNSNSKTPRVLCFANEFINKENLKISKEEVIKYLLKCEQDLNMGEIWAFPIMLRIGVIKRLAKITENLRLIQENKFNGKRLAYKLIRNKEDKEKIIEILNNKEGKKEIFYSEFYKALKDNSYGDKDILNVLKKTLKRSDNDMELLKSKFLDGNLEEEIGHSIISLREIESIDWTYVFEKTSVIEKILLKDPDDTYALMDFKSKEYYRHKIEDLAKEFSITEKAIAEKSLFLAKRAKEQGKRLYKSHVGYYIVDEGIEELSESISKASVKKDTMSPKKFWALNILGTLFIVFLTLLISRLFKVNYTKLQYLIAGLIILIPASEIVVALTNYITSKKVKVRHIPKIDLKNISTNDRTVVIVPTMINTKKKIDSLISKLEVAYLGNKEDNLYFAILADFSDSKEATLEKDGKLNEYALLKTKELNKKYKKDKEIFFFLNRKRKFNKSEGVYMGWERKRGKIMEFITLLREPETLTSFNVISTSLEEVRKSKYIITLDTDTFIKRDTCKKLIGSMKHTLNKAFLKDKKVRRGYGILQPKVSISLESMNKSRFSKIFGGEGGVDGYSTAYSDTYQDLFKEGSFTGKGIIDIDVFYKVLDMKIEENKVLSHDLLEGCYARCGLVSDAELIDDYPSTYLSSSKRLERWVRGDWQLVGWLFKNDLSSLSKWKIFDNLRRSLLAPSILIGLFITVFYLRGGKAVTILLFLALITPLLFSITDFVVTPKNKLNGTFKKTEEILLIISFIPYQSLVMFLAIVRAIYRMVFSKKHLLMWQTAEDIENNIKNTLKGYYLKMWISPLLGVIFFALGLTTSPLLSILIGAISILWIIAPYIAFKISKPIEKEEIEITKEEESYLRNISRRTWAYYEDFVNSENNYLAPDNYQEEPFKGVAYRTSPTNIGMGLISNIVSYDLGYITIGEVIDRLELILSNMKTLEKYKGHYYNWYDTRTKEPLTPRYISTVDSGNLLGYMWIIKDFLEKSLDYKLIRKSEISSLKDIYKILKLEEKDLLDSPKGYNIKSYINTLKEELNNLEQLDFEEEKEKEYWLNKCKAEIKKKIGYFEFCYDGINKLFKSEWEKNPPSINEIEKHMALLYNSSGEEYKDTIMLMSEKIITFKNRILNLINEIKEDMDNMKFDFLYKKERGLFSIGYNLEEDSLGNSYYDLLASESRIASFLTIARSEIDEKHWFKLGRAMTNAYGIKSLVSWSGTMFEYFMPSLIMKNFEGTLLDITYKSVIKAQRRFAKDKRIPFGISESAYFGFDVGENYQYKAFGIPGIGLKRGLENELVISPYSSIMTLPYDFKNSYSNLKLLEEVGALKRYGFIEAIDYTPNRVNKYLNEDIVHKEIDKKEKGIRKGGRKVNCYMVHHLGMSFLALDNILNKNIMQKRFHSIPEVKATETILKEKVPKVITFEREEEFIPKRDVLIREEFEHRIFKGAKRENPEVNILSNGIFSTMVTLTGSGYSKKNDDLLYRWIGDSTTDDSGSFIYIKNLNSNEFWSATYEPCKKENEDYLVDFSIDSSKFSKSEGSIKSELEIVVSPEDNIEIRKLKIKNTSDKIREVELTSYMEVTLTSLASDTAHPSFSNLFIETEYDDSNKILIGKRRARVKNGKVPYIFHKLISEEDTDISYETSRLNFIGRNRSLKEPEALDNDNSLKNNTGIVLDPILSLRSRVSLKGNEEKVVYFITGIALSKEEVLELSSKYSLDLKLESTFNIYNKSMQLELKSLAITSKMANIYQRLASYILFLNDGRRDREKFIENISKHQQDLWAFGISGDLNIIMLEVDSEEDIDDVRVLVKMHYYFKLKGIKADLIIYNNEEASYEEPMQKAILQAIHLLRTDDVLNKQGGIYLHNKSTMGEDIRDFLVGISSLYIKSKKGSVLNQLEDRIIEGETLRRHKELGEIKPLKNRLNEETIKEDRDFNSVRLNNNLQFEFGEEIDFKEEDLDFFNGYGGFNKKDGSYVIKLKDFKNTPAPWINVISNKEFGFHISEVGSAHTWCKNSRENKITPWNNDPVKDKLFEALYIRNDEDFKFSSITPEPVRDGGEYIINHSFGYSSFKHRMGDIDGELITFVPTKEKLKINKIKLKNNSSKTKKLSILYYLELVLGVTPRDTARFITTYNKKDYVYGQNKYSKYFGEDKAYLTAIGGESITFSCDRREFIGVSNDISSPSALNKNILEGTSGSIYDPCLSLNLKVTLEPFETKELVILLGEEESEDLIEEKIEKYKIIENSYKELEKTKEYWGNFLGNIRVKTRDKSMDYLLNGWLLYQNYSCRYLARTAFYQSGGAYGFRDQLQDSLSLGLIDPKITKEQILKNASRQYLEGDVQHWWHPVINSGIRTRFSDDLLWMPYAVVEYINMTGDYSILEEKAPYLEDAPLNEGEDERYTIVNQSNKEGTIYEHCLKAIERGLRFGEHNIPLMGSGDWNDGMSTVGNKGKGESVWLGWFLYKILKGFIPLCERKEDLERSEKYLKDSEFVLRNLEKNAWDGGWYRRAYFDDGTPLGSRENGECKIDSLAQSWSIISEGGKRERTIEAMEAVDRNLVDKDLGLIKLLSPPFEKSKEEPGYIKGYVAGVRENGGQYTHAATWVILALTKLGMGDKAMEYYHMINPINHTETELECRRYKLEPYVMAADVYIREPHGGRGGWSWYTGTAGWMYKVGLQNILGFDKVKDEGYSINPCIPKEWDGFEIFIKNEKEDYSIEVRRGSSKKIIIDGEEIKGDLIPRNLGKANIKVEI